jgi:hypothetical protein
MLEKVRTSPDSQARSWISDFGRLLARRDTAALSRIFQTDSHWRNLCGLSWQMETVSGSQKLARELCRHAYEVGARGFEVDPELLPPRTSVVAGQQVVEAVFRFDTVNGP